MVCANSGRDQRSHSFGCRCVFGIERGSPQSHLGIEKREGFSNFGSSQYQQCWRGITCHGRRCRWTLASSPPVFISAWRYSSEIHEGQTKTRIQARQCQGRFEHQQVVHRCGHLEPCVQKRDRAYEAMAVPARESGISGCSTAHSSSWSGGCTSDCGVCSRFWFHNSSTSIGQRRCDHTSFLRIRRRQKHVLMRPIGDRYLCASCVATSGFLGRSSFWYYRNISRFWYSSEGRIFRGSLENDAPRRFPIFRLEKV